jgi:ABC-type transport system substrate-binding protein
MCARLCPTRVVVVMRLDRAWLRRAGVAFGILAGGGAFAAAALTLFALAVRPDLHAPVKDYTATELEAAQEARDVTIDTTSPPIVWRDVDYTARGPKPWTPKGEPEFLAELVREGKLPPVAERVGSEPLVLEGRDGIGRYGGTWHRISSSVVDLTIIQGRMSGAMLVRWSPEGYPIVPHVAKSFEVSPDHRVFTFHLRRGMRWSDGVPFTADDILFWWEKDIRFLRQEPLWMRSGGKLGRVEKIDALTVRFSFDSPNGVFLEDLCNTPVYALPAHYLAKFHPRDGDPELIVRYMRALRLTSPMAVYARMKDPLNPECPRLWPWIYRTQKAGPPYVFVRNPYFFAVDPAGNQLPYIDRVAFDVKPQNQIGLAASLGEITFQERQIRYEYYTLLMRERERGGYDVYHWFQGARSMFTIFPNINRRIEPDEPETRWKHELLNKKEFRQALSLAINRREIIRAEFNGQSEPAQVDPGPGSPFHSPELFKAFVEYDPARANALLDSIGLTQRDGEGMRTFPDGTRMTFFVHTTDYTGPGPSQLVLDDWEAVGVRAVLKDQARPLWQAQQTALEHDFTVWTSESDFYPMVQPRLFVPTALHAFNAPAYGVWYLNGGMFGDHRALERPGAEEPPPGHPLRRAMEIYNRATQTADVAEQAKLFREIQKIAAENVWTISIGTSPPQPVVVKRGLRNVPRNAIVGSDFTSPSNAGIETFFFDSPQDPPGVVAQTKLEMTEVTPEPRQLAAGQSTSSEAALRERATRQHRPHAARQRGYAHLSRRHAHDFFRAHDRLHRARSVAIRARRLGGGRRARGAQGPGAPALAGPTNGARA